MLIKLLTNRLVGHVPRLFNHNPNVQMPLFGHFLTRGLRGSRYRKEFIESIEKELEDKGQLVEENEGPSQSKQSNPGQPGQPEDLEYIQMSKEERRARVQEMLKNASTYSDLEDPAGTDPFLSTPYVKGTPKPEQLVDEQDQDQDQKKRPYKDPANASIVLFPGQGSQYVGMCGSRTEMPKYIRMLYDSASEILGFNLLDACLDGPAEKLNKTIVSQPAVIISSLAALEILRERREDIEKTCVATCGFSVGEITAFVFSGILSFEDAIRLVKVRSEAMHLACDLTPSAMSTVFYGADSKLNFALTVAKEWCTREYKIENPVCQVANYLFPHCKIIGGNREAIEFVENNFKDFKLRKLKRLPVEGAFHTEIMRPAADAVKAALETIKVNEPRIPVYSNVTGKRYHAPPDIKKNFRRQTYLPVRWEQILHEIYKRPKESEFPHTYEVGPGSSLCTILKLVNAKAHSKSKCIAPSISQQNANEARLIERRL